MMQGQKFLWAGLALSMLGCLGGSTSEPSPSGDQTGSVSIAITNAPTDGTCIQVIVVGTRTVTHSFDVAAGASTVFTMSGLPVGSDTFTANAFSGTCSMVTSMSTPTWVSDAVVQNVQTSPTASVTLPMHHNGNANVSVDFQADDAGSCTSPQVLCSGVCTSLQTDPKNCGSCGTQCMSGVCTNGACTCPTGDTLCNGACTNLQSDSSNCGGCGVTCPAGSPVCSMGVCTTCPAGDTLCSGVCTSLATDPKNCGSCGTMCASGVCTSGVCSTSCPTGETLCGTTCTSLQTDPNNCGACGNSCAATPTTPNCVSGKCSP